MVELVEPRVALHAAFVDCVREWGPGEHEDGFGLVEGDEVDSPEWFAAYVAAITRLSHPAGTPCPVERHATWGWMLEDGRVQGSIVLRHVYDDEVGHIAYGVRPSARRIESVGGVLEGIRPNAEGALVRRYWVPTS